jgi:hypothetical protein
MGAARRPTQTRARSHSAVDRNTTPSAGRAVIDESPLPRPANDTQPSWGLKT